MVLLDPCSVFISRQEDYMVYGGVQVRGSRTVRRKTLGKVLNRVELGCFSCSPGFLCHLCGA